MKALILAAGKGERLKELTIGRPKTLVEVAGRPLIEYIFEFLDHSSITEIGIVGGYKFDILNEYLKTRRPPRRTSSPQILKPAFYNPLFHEGSVRTIMTALDFLDDDIIIMNTDHIYPLKLLEKFIAEAKGVTVACDFDRKLGADDMKVKLSNGGRWGDLIKISKDLKDFDCGYIGMTFVAKSELAEYKKAVHETYEIKGKTSNAEAVLGHMAENRYKIGIADLSGFGWHEIDTIEDKINYEEKI